MKRAYSIPAVLLLAAAVLLSCEKKPQPPKIIKTPVTPAAEIFSSPATPKDNHQIYQVNLKLYGQGGTAFGKVEARLDEIKALGTEYLYLMPVYREGTKNAIGSPYCIRNFKEVNPSYGTLADLKHLVDAAHSKGMKVMFDWVANHTSWDNAWITEHPDWYEKDAKGNIVYPTRDGAWTDVAQLDYSNEALWDGMIDALKYWVTECGIDGYRCDYAHGVRDDFWKKAIAELHSLRPSLVMLAESDYTKMFSDGFDIIFDRAMKSRVRTLWNGGKAADFFSWYKDDLASAPDAKTKLFFITNHDDNTTDVPATLFKGSDGALAAYAFMTALNGSSMIYGSQEVAYDKTINFFNTMTLDFGANADYLSRYRKVMAALSKLDRSTEMKVYQAGSVLFIGYGASSKSKACVVGINVSSSGTSAAVPSVLSGKKATELVSGAAAEVEEEVAFDPFGIKVWQLN